MTSQITTGRRVWIALALLAVCALYLGDLSGMGLVSKDEPRYADISRGMAGSGDWITPRLWGEPWFEKPPLLYWLGAIGFLAGLGPELAPRLPVALLSVAFLIFFWWTLRRIWDEASATCATALLATSGGWLAFSHVAVTDLPLSVMFCAAVLFAMEGRRTAAALALGLAVLAKSLVPLVLFVPVLAMDYRSWREWLRRGPVLAFLLVSVPWHVLCAMRNGRAFFDVLFVQQQFGRFHSTALQHVQPWWFYIPVLLLLLFPWFPLLAVSARERIPLAVAVWGFVFFSASVNKLPGYVLPLVPFLCILMGVGLARRHRHRIGVAFSFAMLALVPLAADVLPAALADGTRSALRTFRLASTVPSLVIILLAFALPLLRQRALGVAVGCAAIAMFGLQIRVFPQIDSAVSARPFWLAHRPICADPSFDRGMLYGLYYYAGHALPECTVLDQNDKGVVR